MEKVISDVTVIPVYNDSTAMCVDVEGMMICLGIGLLRVGDIL